MRLFIDASGTISFFSGRSYYVLAVVYFDLNDVTGESQLINSVTAFKEENGLKPNKEIKWTELNRNLKKAFVNCLANSSLKFITFTTERSRFQYLSDMEFLKIAFATVLRVGKENGIIYPEIISDKDFSNEWCFKLHRWLTLLHKQRVGLNELAKIALVDSRCHVGIQVADFLAGLYRTMVFSKKESSQSAMQLYVHLRDKHVANPVAN